MRFLARIIGNVIGNILSKLLALAAVAAGVQYFLTGSVNLNGLSGVLDREGGASAIAGLPIPEDAMGAFNGLLKGGASGASGLSGAMGNFGGPKPTSSKFFAAKARVAKIEIHCRLLDLDSIPATQTKPMNCMKAFELKTNPAFAAHDLKETRTIEYIYYGKDGATVHTGVFVPEGHRRFTVGDVIDVEVSNRDDSSSRVSL